MSPPAAQHAGAGQCASDARVYEHIVNIDPDLSAVTVLNMEVKDDGLFFFFYFCLEYMAFVLCVYWAMVLVFHLH